MIRKCDFTFPTDASELACEYGTASIIWGQNGTWYDQAEELPMYQGLVHLGPGGRIRIMTEPLPEGVMETEVTIIADYFVSPGLIAPPVVLLGDAALVEVIESRLPSPAYDCPRDDDWWRGIWRNHEHSSFMPEIAIAPALDDVYNSVVLDRVMVVIRAPDPVQEFHPADVNRDGKINVLDLIAVRNAMMAQQEENK
jgi:hypothetical protein